jgi:ATP-binding cassette, subfamily C, bacterial
MDSNKIKQNKLYETLKEAKPVFTIIFLFAFVVNIFNLITPFYSLQVLDRVLSSRSVDTLLFLTLVMLGVYIALTLMQIARSFTLIKLGEWLDKKLSPELLSISLKNAATQKNVAVSNTLRDFQQVKSFLTSIGINTVFDAPWSIAYIIVLFIIHPIMGWISVVGAILICLSALINAFAVNQGISQSNEYNIKSLHQSEIANRNAEVIEAMGMVQSVVKHWSKFNSKSLEYQSVSSYRNGIISNFSRYMVRMVLAMLVTGVGAYLVLQNQMTTGGMIVSSIMLGKALAPFDNAIEIWKQISTTSKSYSRLVKAFEDLSSREESMKLPTPEGRISVENIFFTPNKTKADPNQPAQNYVLKGVSLDLDPGDILAIIGPSAAGKSTLAKLLVGVWKPDQGVVRLDGADVYTWDRNDFGNHVGYLPQDVELFGGSIKSNISRLSETPSAEEVVKAAQQSGAHDLILRMQKGYDTDIGIGGANLSGGQRQRIGLARAFYGNPKLVVLDEPNANLDEAGEKALVLSLENAKKNKVTTIVISHRPSILSSVDKILILQNGMVAAFGTQQEIMSKFINNQNASNNKNDETR